ncbi:MAG: vWA domain-containing protein [Planctomycetota bacterium]|jgi:hypothetical protein
MSILLQNPYGLFALSSLLAVGAIYLFYRQRRPIRVSALFLWEGLDREKAGGRELRPPTSSRSLWLDLLAALLLSLAVAGPALLLDSGAQQVIILDDSLSMQSRNAHHRALSHVQGLVDPDRPPVILLAGPIPRVLVPLGADGADLGPALEQYHPHGKSANLEAAIRLARDLVSGDMDIHLFTDHDRPLIAPPKSLLHLHTLAAAGVNPAFLQARRILDKGEDTLLLTVGGTDRPTPLRVEAKGVELHAEMIPALSEKRQRLTLTLPAGIGAVTCSLAAGNDCLTADSRVTLVPPPNRKPSFAITLADTETAKQVRFALNAAGAQEGRTELLVTSSPTAEGSLITLRLPNPSLQGTTPTFAGPYIIDTAHPLGRDLDLTGIYWSAGSKELDPDHLSLVLAGKRPLLTLSPRGVIALDLLPGKSNITRTPAWPVLFANMVDLCEARKPGLKECNYTPNQPLELVEFPGYHPSEEPPAFIDGEGLSIPVGSLTSANTPPLPGIYRLKDEERIDTPIAVNAIAPGESLTRSLAPLDQNQTLTPPGENHERMAPRSLVWLLALLAAALLLLNLALNRRGGSA